MPTFYSIDGVRKVVLSGSKPPLTRAELLAHVNGLPKDPRFDPSFRQIIDFRGVTTKALLAAEMKTIAALNPFLPTTRRAAVVDSVLIYGLVRMYQGLTGADAEQMRLFADMAEACEWLGLDPDTPWPDPPDVVFTIDADPASS